MTDTFQLIDLTDGGQIKIGESTEEGSFVRTEGDNPSITVKFKIFGAEDASTAYLALLNYLQTYFDDGSGGIANYDLPLSTVQISTTPNNYAYTGECVFQFPTTSEANDAGETSQDINSPSYTMPEVEDADYSFSTVGGTSHVSYGILLGSARYDGGQPVNYNGMINPNEEGGADGCDIVTPTMSFDISVSLPKAWFSVAYRLAIANATGCINAAPWGGYAAGCCLFKGVDAKATWMKWTDSVTGMACRDWYWRATFHFEAAPPVTFNVGNVTLLKRGFDVASQVRAAYANPDTGDTVTVAEQVDIIQPYPTFDFALLNLPMPN